MGQTIACPLWIPDEYGNADAHKNISVAAASGHKFRPEGFQLYLLKCETALQLELSSSILDFA